MKNTIVILYVLLIFVLTLVFGQGCAMPPPPDHYSIDPDFSAAHVETIRSVFDAYCAKVGYCPTEAGTDGPATIERGMIELVDTLPEDGYTRRHCPEGMACTTAGTNDGANRILIARDRPEADDLAQFWEVVAHEVGHYCIPDHIPESLMNATDEGLEARPLEVDDKTARAWKENCGDVQSRMPNNVGRPDADRDQRNEGGV